MQGFLNFRLSRSLRLIITRLVTILPLTILSSLNDDVVDSICRYVNIAQAFLLPFALIPLLLFSFSSRIMGVFIITGWRKWGVCTLAACVTLGNYAIAIYQIYTSQLLTTSSSSSTFFFFFFSSSYRHVYYLGLAVLLFAYACLLIGMMRQKIRGVFCLYLLASHTYSSSSSASPRLDSIENEAFQSTSTFCGEEHRRHEEKRRRMACAKERREDLLMKGKDIEKEVLQGGGEEEEEGGSGGEEEIRRMSMKGGGC
ncbi:divalent metal transporter [Cystoisospora suis]|uniref:Divalent metal transporter n=1 Tax=Cystoisospora suis TaxID=483139 RepID=A0A2C6J6N7_9APIC|nr:divalent metal transporter [Cystoisospora suis]